MSWRMQTALGAMNDAINELLARSEKLGEDGDVDGAQAVAAQAEHRKVHCLANLPALVMSSDKVHCLAKVVS